MTKTNLPTAVSASFESLKQANEHGAEYWSARDLQPLLGYTQWRRFEQAIDRAKVSCETSGNNPVHHFAGVGKMIEVGKGGQREVPENIATAEHIKEVEKRLKSTTPKLELEKRDAGGLLGDTDDKAQDQ